jgi:uncharacterized small protein (DUF1192 family)
MKQGSFQMKHILAKIIEQLQREIERLTKELNAKK